MKKLGACQALRHVSSSHRHLRHKEKQTATDGIRHAVSKVALNYLIVPCAAFYLLPFLSAEVMEYTMRKLNQCTPAPGSLKICILLRTVGAFNYVFCFWLFELRSAV